MDYYKYSINPEFPSPSYNHFSISDSKTWIDLDRDNSGLNTGMVDSFIEVRFNNYGESYLNGKSSYFMYIPVFPEDVTFNINPNYADQQIVGRSGNVSSYTNTGDVGTSFSLHLHREMHHPNNSANKNEVDAIVSLIQGANYAQYTDNCSKPPIVTYKFGDTYIVGKQKNSSVKWTGTKINGVYMEAFVTISVDCVPRKVISFDDVFEASPRGMNLF